MTKHGPHMWICGAMVVLAGVLIATTGNAAALIPALGCVLMMVVMMSMMGGNGRAGDK